VEPVAGSCERAFSIAVRFFLDRSIEILICGEWLTGRLYLQASKNNLKEPNIDLTETKRAEIEKCVRKQMAAGGKEVSEVRWIDDPNVYLLHLALHEAFGGANLQTKRGICGIVRHMGVKDWTDRHPFATFFQNAKSLEDSFVVSFGVCGEKIEFIIDDFFLAEFAFQVRGEQLETALIENGLAGIYRGILYDYRNVRYPLLVKAVCTGVLPLSVAALLG
jgi:hypothetical protein